MKVVNQITDFLYTDRVRAHRSTSSEVTDAILSKRRYLKEPGPAASEAARSPAIPNAAIPVADAER
jgi:hypothetical protein